MGPTNIALVRYYKADQALREAQGRYDAAARSVRIQERRLADLNEKLRLAQGTLQTHQLKQGELDLDIKTRDARIDRLRGQQQEAKNHKEYQAFLTEINTEKIDKAKTEDESLKVMQLVENSQREVADLQAQIGGETKKTEEIRQQLSARLAQLQGEVDALKPAVEDAKKGVTPKAMAAYERLADRFEGEALAPVGKPDRRREEYNCGSCHMGLVVDVYNRLHTRDDLVTCPNCHRLLYIPDDLPPEEAIKKRPERREPRNKNVTAVVGRQTSAADILNSMRPDEDEAAETPSGPPAESAAESATTTAPSDAPSDSASDSASAVAHDSQQQPQQ